MITHDLLFLLFVGLAITDYMLTMFWIRRWYDSNYLSHLKYRIPVKLIERNPLIRVFVSLKGKNTPWTIMVTLGYLVVYMIQTGLFIINIFLGLLVCILLMVAIVGHVINNLKISDEYILKVTEAYNKRIEDGRK